MNSTLSKPKILIVDDVPANIHALWEVLKSDYRIVFAQNGEDALKLATSETPPNLILLDIVMPGMDGYEVCRRLKADDGARNIPVIFITARRGEEDEAEGLRLGAIDYITKPINVAIVKARVKTHLELDTHRNRLEELVRQRTAELTRTNERLQDEIAARKLAEEELREAHGQLERRVEERTFELRETNQRLMQEIAERKRTEKALQEKEEYLRTIMATIQTGLVVLDPVTFKILDANAFVLKMVGLELQDLVGNDYSKFMLPEAPDPLPSPTDFAGPGDQAPPDGFLRTANGGMAHVRRSSAPLRIRDRSFLIESFLDITDIKHLLKKQEISINLAKKILGLVNGTAPRYTDLGNGLTLFADAVSIPCNAEGGDHFFVRNPPANGRPGPSRTVVSVKDQSGHEVGCILRSIISDFVHNSILDADPSIPIERAVTELNKVVCGSGLFNRDDFFTSISAELDHATLLLRFVSAGHPPFFLIRGDEVMGLPRSGGAGTNIPVAVGAGMEFTAGEHHIQPHDRLIFYTDGLNEMPQRNLNSTVTTDEMKDLIGEIVRRNPEATASDIMRAVLDAIAKMCDEEVVPPSRNSSGDDITVLCMEVEREDNCTERVYRPGSTDEVFRIIEDLYGQLGSEWNRRGYRKPEIRLRTVLEESILNAWNHGNCKKPHRPITVKWRYGNDFHLEVLDDGEGFDVGCVPDPTLHENVTKPFGRGIFMMRCYAGDVKWLNCGRRLVLTFEKDFVPGSEGEDGRSCESARFRQCRR